MNQVTQVPAAVTSAGHEFNYAVWTAGTRVYLCNVPWNSDYRDIVKFPSEEALQGYLREQTGPIIDVPNVIHHRVGVPIRLNVPFSNAYKYNYLVANNPSTPGHNDWQNFYYFIQDVRYINASVTEFVIQLDVWQTFHWSAQFGNCYIERGHIGIANENAFNDYGREFLTVPEGLDVGSEYRIEEIWSRDIASARTTSGYSIMVVSTVSLTEDAGTVDAPKLNSAGGSSMENLPNGAEVYIFANVTDFRVYLNAMKDKPWITQGIISIMAIPPHLDYGIPLVSEVINGVSVMKPSEGTLNVKQIEMKNNWRDHIGMGFGGRYNHLKKFWTYPYMVLELTSYTGTPLLLKPEMWAHPHASVVEVPHFAPPGARLAFYPEWYNRGAAMPATDDDGIVHDGGEFLDMATGIFNFPTFSIVNNGYMNYLASNSNSIAFQYHSADWSQQKALSGNQLNYDQSSAAIGLSQNVNRQGINASTASTNLANETGAYRAMLGAGTSILNGIASGNAAGAGAGLASAATTGISYAIDVNQRNQQLGIETGLSSGVNRAQNENAAYVRDTNRAYADAVAVGDYENAIASINAKVQDAKLIQPSTSGQVGGDAFLLSMYKWGYDVKVKILNSQALHAIGEFWLRYGYAVNRFGRMPADFQCMQHFTYWKLKETYITGANMPEFAKQAIRGIFEKGVTVWANPDFIGNVDVADNAPRTGIRL